MLLLRELIVLVIIESKSIDYALTLSTVRTPKLEDHFRQLLLETKNHGLFAQMIMRLH